MSDINSFTLCEAINQTMNKTKESVKSTASILEEAVRSIDATLKSLDDSVRPVESDDSSGWYKKWTELLAEHHRTEDELAALQKEHDDLLQNMERNKPFGSWYGKYVPAYTAEELKSNNKIVHITSYKNELPGYGWLQRLLVDMGGFYFLQHQDDKVKIENCKVGNYTGTFIFDIPKYKEMELIAESFGKPVFYTSHSVPYSINGKMCPDGVYRTYHKYCGEPVSLG